MVLLACGPPRPDMRPQPGSLTEAVPAAPPVVAPAPAPAPPPVAPECGVAALEVVVTAPKDGSLFVDSATLPLARREVPAGTVMREVIAPAPIGAHMIVVRDKGGEVVTSDVLPVIVLPGERHLWSGAEDVPHHRIERCVGGVRELLQHEDAEIPTNDWGPPMVSADGATIARLATYTKSSNVQSDLALVDVAQGFRRMPLLSTLVLELEVDAKLFAAASEVLKKGGYRRLGADERLPVFEVAAAGGQARARWGGRAGAAATPAVPRDHRRGCCAWQVGQGMAWGPTPTAVVVEMKIECSTGKELCADEMTYGAPYSQALLAIPLTGEASGKPRHRLLPDAALDRLPDALGPKEQLAHMLYVGPFGPTPDGVLVLRTDDIGTLTGFLHTTVDGRSRRMPLPPVPWVMHQVDSVLFEDADGDGADEAVVLVTAMAGAGPTAAEEFNGAHIFKWDGTKVVTLPEAELRVGTRTNAVAVRRALAKR